MQPSRFRQISLATPLRLGGLALIMIAACALLFWHFVLYPACDICDVVAYGVDAARLQSYDFAVSERRTYGYPLFLGVVFAGYDWDATWGVFSPRAAIVQTLLYLAACLTLFFAILPRSSTFAWCAAVGLMCNPFVLNYVPLRMTEGVTASIAVLIAACAVSFGGHSSTRRLVAILFAGSLLAGLAMMIRPASLSLFIAWGAAVAIVVWQSPGRRVLACIAATAGMVIPLLPQLAINYFVYQQIGFFPAKDLGGMQRCLGLANFKYQTIVMSDRSVVPVFYRSAVFTSAEIGAHGVWLYLVSPLRGAAIIAGHIFQSVNHDYFFPYVHDRNAWQHAPLNAIGHMVLYLAGYACWVSARSNQKAFAPVAAAVFALVAVVLTILVNSLVAVETRFGMLIYLAAGPLATWGAVRLWSSPRRGMVAAAGLLFGLSAAALSFAMLPKGLATTASYADQVKTGPVIRSKGTGMPEVVASSPTSASDRPADSASAKYCVRGSFR